MLQSLGVCMTLLTLRLPTRLRIQLLPGLLAHAVDLSLLFFLLPDLFQSGTVSLRWIAWLVAVGACGAILGTPLCTRVAALFGWRRTTLLATGLYIAGALFFLATDGLALLLIGRVLQGLGIGGLSALSEVYSCQTEPRRWSAIGLAILAAGYIVMLGVSLTLGLLLRTVPFGLLLLPLAAGGVAGCVAWYRLSDQHPIRHYPFDWRGLLLIALSLIMLAVGIAGIDLTSVEASFQNVRVWPFVLLGLSLLPLLRMVEHHSPNPIVQPRLFSLRQVMIAALLTSGAGFVQSAFVLLPTFLTAHQTALALPTIWFAPFLSLILVGSMLLTGRILAVTGSRIVVWLSAGLIVLGAGLLIWLPLELHWLVMGLLLISSGLAAQLGVALAFMLLNEANLNDRLAALHILTMSLGLGQLVGSLVLGGAASVTSGTTAMQLIFGLIVLVGLLQTLGACWLKSHRVEQATIERNRIRDAHELQTHRRI
jgi:MFS family permease